MEVLPRMRGIKAAIEELKAADPGTALTEKGLRRLILTGQLPVVRFGCKYLINMDVLYEFLSGTAVEPESIPENKINTWR